MRSLFLIVLSFSVLAGCARQEQPEPPIANNPACTTDWFESVEARLGTGDGQGHGPDIGSQEWFSVVEFRLGLRGQSGVPQAGTDRWCHFIEEQLEPVPQTDGVSPSFNCSAAEALSSAEQHVCGDAELTRLDLTLAQVYEEAQSRVKSESAEARLKAEQRGWLKGRDECWKASDARTCIADAYQRRIATLQARYRLVSFNGPVLYRCGPDSSELAEVRFFDTEPSTAVVQYGDNYALMFATPAASGARYEGRNEVFWEHQGEALIRWGFSAAEVACQRSAN